MEKPPPFKRMTQGSIPWGGTMKYIINKIRCYLCWKSGADKCPH